MRLRGKIRRGLIVATILTIVALGIIGGTDKRELLKIRQGGVIHIVK